MIRAQGGDPDAELPTAKETHHVLAPADGVLVQLDALAVGVAAWRLGGRSRPQGGPGPGRRGVELHHKPGATVRGGEPLMTLHTDEPERFARALEALEGGFTIAPRVRVRTCPRSSSTACPERPPRPKEHPSPLS